MTAQDIYLNHLRYAQRLEAEMHGERRLSTPRLPIPKPDHYNVRVITRMPCGGIVEVELTEVPREKYLAHFGMPALDDLFEDGPKRSAAT